MNEPLRLRDSAGAARLLLRGAELAVPTASRRRALAFTAAAANLAAGGTALAAGTGISLAKSVALCVSLGVVGGGVASLGVSSAISRWEAPREVVTARAPVAPPALPTVSARSAEPAPVAADEPVVPEPPSESPPAAVKGAAPLRSAPAPAARPPSLFDEQRMIEGARVALARGDAAGGLRLLDEYARGFPKGQFHPEALALRVEALSRRGEARRAEALADEFARRYPQHPLLGRVQASVGRR